jgi:hypothetical protein
MTVTLKLKPEVEAGLLEQARASGMTLEEYLLSMVEGAVLLKAQVNASAEERAAAFEAWSTGHRPTPPLSDYAVSREAMYEAATTDACLWTRIFCSAVSNSSRFFLPQLQIENKGYS